MKKINPLGIVLMLLLLFAPRQKDDDRVNNDSSSSVNTKHYFAPVNPQERNVVPGESTTAVHFAGSRASE